MLYCPREVQELLLNLALELPWRARELEALKLEYLYPQLCSSYNPSRKRNYSISVAFNTSHQIYSKRINTLDSARR